MFELAKFLPTPISNNKEYHDANWDTRDMSYKEGFICKTIKEVLTTAIQEEIGDKDIDFCDIISKDCIDLLGTLEAKDKRRRVTW